MISQESITNKFVPPADCLCVVLHAVRGKKAAVF